MAERLVTLVVPFGAETVPISFGTTVYRPYLADPENPASPWLVKMPADIAQHFTHNRGFSMDKEVAGVPDGMVKLRHPEGIGCSFGDTFYKPDANGYVLVPVAAGGILIETHGFRAPGAAVEVPADPRDAELARLRAENEALQAQITAAGAQPKPPRQPKATKAADGATGPTGPEDGAAGTGDAASGATGATGADTAAGAQA